MRLATICWVIAAGVLAFGAAEACADSITGVGFVRITDNNVEDVADQFSLDILDHTTANRTYGLRLGQAQVLFAYRNTAEVRSSISEIYVDNFDCTLRWQTGVYNSLGGFTRYGWGASPVNLPDGDDLDPAFTANRLFSVDARGHRRRGLDRAADVLGVAFWAPMGVGAIEAALEAGTLRIGMHVRSIGAARGRDSFVTEFDPAIGYAPVTAPEPTTLTLTALGLLGGVGLMRRRRR